MNYLKKNPLVPTALGLVAALAACTTTTTTTTTGGTDSGVDSSSPVDAGTVETGLPQDAAPTPAPDAAPNDGGGGGGPVIACYEEDQAFLLEAIRPTRSPSFCSNAAIDDSRRACLSATSTQVGCEAFIAANTECARCLFGGVDGDDPAKIPVGAIIPLSDVAVSPNVGACAALVIERPECAVPVSRELVCTSSACSTCRNSASTTACQTQAATAICKDVGDAACTAAIDAASAQWLPLCRGTAFTDTFAKVARVMCGAP